MNDPIFERNGDYSRFTLDTLKPIVRAQFTVYRGVAAKGEPLSHMWAQAKQQAAKEGKQPLVVEGTCPGGYKILVGKGFRKNTVSVNGKYEVISEWEFLTLLADRLEQPI